MTGWIIMIKKRVTKMKSNHLAENKYFMYGYFHEFKRHLQFLPMWSGVCELENPNEKLAITNALTELHFHLKSQI